MCPHSRGALRPSYPNKPPSKHQRAQGMPDARCTRSRLCSKKSTGVSNHRYAAINRHSLRDGFNGVLRALPGDRAILPPSSVGRTTDLAPASGRQNHTTSPSACAVIRLMTCRVHRIPHPTSVTIASRPSSRERDERRKPLIWGPGKAKSFSRQDWTTQISLNRLAKLGFTRRSYPGASPVPIESERKL